MSQWQQRFAEKLELVRMASRERFEGLAKSAIDPTFDDLQAFTSNLGMQPSRPVSKEGMRTYKFSMSENAYALLSFRLADLEHAESTCEFFVPGRSRPAATKRTTPLVEVSAEEVRAFFEQSLDTFAEAFIESLSARGARRGELVTSS